MKYVVDHDLHIHSYLSTCSGNPDQNPERILQYAKENGLRTVCVTDHFWDEAVEGASKWYQPQNFEHITSLKPLPQGEGIRFLFGCETDLKVDLTLGISKEKLDRFDFIIVPTTHFHTKGFALTEEEMASARGRAKAWIRRLEGVLNLDLPFERVGIAHLTCTLLAPTREEVVEVLNLLPNEELKRLFTKAASLGVGIELNQDDLIFSEKAEDAVLRIYRIAKEQGCKFYCGSDAHSPGTFACSKEIFQRAVDRLGLTEEDKFVPAPVK